MQSLTFLISMIAFQSSPGSHYGHTGHLGRPLGLIDASPTPR